MKSALVVHPNFDFVWPFAADHLRQLLALDGEVTFIRLSKDSTQLLSDIVQQPESYERLISLRVPVTISCLELFTNLEEVVIADKDYGFLQKDSDTIDYLNKRGIRVYAQPTEGFWGQSVSEFALALTLCGLRRIPQTHHEIITSVHPWDYSPAGGDPIPNARGQQFGDDVRFTNGTVEGKRVRIVGAGNIASRYASFVHMLGADVAAWDPYASEPSFHRAGSRKEWHLERLVRDAEIFVPMVPLTEQTLGIITAENIGALPQGTLVVLATRAQICDMHELRRRVLADELSLAADVFDIEPLPLDDPLLGRDNVVHTPHNAGRTKEANFQYAAKLYEQFIVRR
ncbi:NAD(P)-dependent oxidoreductase [Paenibacillus sp. Soil750]|uniref:NAD(P)-dependent oxidoreductase n=1 Tax=Paenibacillus sp. Soil750 TaxID=1736398 RepID=UPI0006F3EBB5|nr:NAD(P)-dependent oxidoreductase [Paenibacillus sp. Soil750]KRE63337.1 hydroxyacid dehydrogenase [Paenibacillus sp. Soil750]